MVLKIMFWLVLCVVLFCVGMGLRVFIKDPFSWVSFSSIVIIFFALFVTLACLTSTGDLKVSERKDFAIIRGKTFVSIDIDGENYIFENIQFIESSKDIDVIYVKEKWNLFGFPISKEILF